MRILNDPYRRVRILSRRRLAQAGTSV